MGVRKEGSGKSRPKMNIQGVVTTARGAAVRSTEHASNTSNAAGDAGGEDSDSELQEVYVQAYACQLFRDDAAARAVDGGAHLRPLASPQDPEGEPLMLDRFDARWMLDMTDFSKGAGARVPADLVAEEGVSDSFRYAGLPSVDHSLEVEGLGRFAPQGSYANERNRGGLGDEEEEEEDQPEVYGYYGRTASPPPVARGAWSATPGPQHSVDGGLVASPAAPLPSAAGALGVAVSSEGDASKGEEDEAFVPDFGVPLGVAVPPTVRQHMMIVGTARTTVRSPQLEVLLRLKQAANAAFSFLSVDDPVHSYYLFLKSWGESALAAEYTRQQRLQAELVDSRQRDENERQERRDQGAAGKAAGTLPPLPPPAEQSDSSDGGPNLLGGAYDSSGDEDDDRGLVAEATTVAAGISATTSSSASPRERSDGASRVTLPLAAVGGCERSEGEAGDTVVEGRKADVCESAVPDEAKRVVVDKMVGFVARNGRAFEERVREREKSNPTFDFLLASNQFHAYYKTRLAAVKGEAPAVLSTRNSIGESNELHNRGAAAVVSQKQTAAVSSSAVGGAWSGSPSGGGGGASDEAGRAAVYSALAIAGNSATRQVAGQTSARERPSADALAAGYDKAPSGSDLATPSTDDSKKETPAALRVENPASTGARARNNSVWWSADRTGVSSGSSSPRDDSSDGTATADRNASGDYASTATEAVTQANRAGVIAVTAEGIATGLPATVTPGVAAGGGRSEENGNIHESAVVESITAADSVLSESDGGRSGEGSVVPETVSPPPAVSQEGEGAGVVAAIAGEDAETRRANRLKRARLMKGHYKLAVMHHSTGKENAPDGGGQQGAVLEDLSAGGGGEAAAAEGSEDGDGDSADGLSDFDVESDSDDLSGDAGDCDGDGGASGGSETGSQKADGDIDTTPAKRGEGDRRASGGHAVEPAGYDGRRRSGLSDRKGKTDRSSRRDDPSRTSRRRSRSRSDSRERDRGGTHGRTRNGDRSRKESTGTSRGHREITRDSSRADKGSDSRSRRRTSPDRRSQDRRNQDPRRHSSTGDGGRRSSGTTVRDSSRRDKIGDSRRPSETNGGSSKFSRKTDDRAGRSDGRSGARVVDSGQRTKDSRSDRGGGNSRTSTKGGRRVEHEYRDRNKRRSRSAERGDSRERGGSDKRSRRR